MCVCNGGQNIEKPCLTTCLAISVNLEQVLYCFFTQQILASPLLGEGVKIQKLFLNNFLSIQTIYNFFYFFSSVLPKEF